MTARITKATLLAQLEQAHVAYERQAAELAALRAEVEALRKPVAPRREQRAESDFAAACRAAREAAMKTGRVVRVGA